MPRKATRRSILTTLKQQTTRALASLQKEISRREKELEELKAEAGRWGSVLGKEVKVERAAASLRRALRKQVKAGSASASSRRAKSTRRAQKVQKTKKVQRLDWSAVLGELPKTFTTKEVAQKTGKPMAQVHDGVSRWVKAKKVRKGKDGYQKV